jgi:hypothetical protein
MIILEWLYHIIVISITLIIAIPITIIKLIFDK